MGAFDCFQEVWFYDFEFHAPGGHRPTPICMVALELHTGKTLRLWQNELRLRDPPFNLAASSLFVCYYASAELSCHLALKWPMPARVLDLYAEFACLTSGLPAPCGKGLLGALAYHGLNGGTSVEKEGMRGLAIRGGPFTEEERRALLKYCESDVTALRRLFESMRGGIDLPRALLRGRYMAASACMEWNGVPIDTGLLGTLREHWTDIQKRLIREIDRDYGVFDGRTFKLDRWEAWLARNKVPWPRLDSGRLDLSDGTFRQAARAYPQVAPIRELRHALSQLRLSSLSIGPDGRNRTILSAFRSRSGRNQPSNSKYIFGPSVWLRSLIRAPRGRAVAYVDWSQQEFAIAGALSGDRAMQAAYRSGDPYLTFAKQAGAVPETATKQTHSSERERFKICALATQYSMGPRSLALRIGQPERYGRELLELHRRTYARFWEWNDRVLDRALLTGQLETVFGWQLHLGPGVNVRTVRNFPMQAHGAEMLRLACCEATETGLMVCAPVHDAILIEAAAEEVDDAVRALQQIMQRAGEIVLDGFPLRTDAEVFRHPDRYRDPRGDRMWTVVKGILARVEEKERSASLAPPGRPVWHPRSASLAPPYSLVRESSRESLSRSRGTSPSRSIGLGEWDLSSGLGEWGYLRPSWLGANIPGGGDYACLL